MFQCASLRYTFTEETRKIYDSLAIDTDEVNVIIETPENFSKGIVNETLERIIFFLLRQKNEPFRLPGGHKIFKQELQFL